MMVSLLMSVLAAPAASAVPATVLEPDPPVQVWLSSEAAFMRGDRARVFLRTEQDGYVLILHSDADGRVRVLFPLDPGQDEFVRGGQNLEILGRGNREAFLVDERDGTGTVFAAWSPDPFRFDGLILADHWDYRTIALFGTDVEASLLDIADRAAAGQRYFYDVAEYIVGRPVTRTASSVYFSLGNSWPYCVGCWDVGYRAWSPGFSFSISIGSPWRYASSWYDPWYYHRYPVYYGPSWYDPFRGPRYRPGYVWYPYPNYYRAPRYRAVHFPRYADSCWGNHCNRWNPPRGRSGKATGVGFSQADWRTAYGLSEPVRGATSLGMARFVRQNERSSQPRFADVNTSPDRMRSVLSSGRDADGSIDRGARSRVAQQRGGSETGRFETRPGNGVSRAVRAGETASGRTGQERASTDPARQNTRIGGQVRDPAANGVERRSNTGIRATDGGRQANPRSSGQAAGPERSWIISPPQRGSGNNTRTQEIGSSGSTANGRATQARPANESNARERIRSQAGSSGSAAAPSRASQARPANESSARERIRSSATGGSGATSSPPARQGVTRSSGSASSPTRSSPARSSGISSAVPRQNVTRSSGASATRSSPARSSGNSSAVPRTGSTIRSQQPVRSSSPARSSGPARSSAQRAGGVATRVSAPSRTSSRTSAPARSTVTRPSTSGRASTSSRSTGSASRAGQARSSGGASRSSGTVSRAGQSRASGSAAKSGGSSRIGSAARRKN